MVSEVKKDPVTEYADNVHRTCTSDFDEAGYCMFMRKMLENFSKWAYAKDEEFRFELERLSKESQAFNDDVRSTFEEADGLSYRTSEK